MNPIIEKQSQKTYLVGVSLVLVGTVFFSAKSIFIKKIYTYGLDPDTLMVLRMAMAAPVYLLIYLLHVKPNHKKLAKTEIGKIGAVGVLGYYVASYLDLSGLMYITASFERMILYLFPSFVLLISVVFFKHRLRLTEVFAFVLSYLGILVIYMQDFRSYGHETTYGMLLVLGSAMVFSVFTVFSGKYIARAGSIRFTSISMLGASIAIMFHYLVNSKIGLGHYDNQAYGLVFFLALFCTVLPSFLINMGVSRIGAPRAAILGTISPMFTVVMAFVFLNETGTFMHIVGFTLTILGIAVISLPKRMQKPQTSLSQTERQVSDGS